MFNIGAEPNDVSSHLSFESRGWIFCLEKFQVAPHHLGCADPATEAGRHRIQLLVWPGKRVDERENENSPPDRGRA
jgi:hypothetical protein